jgi:hypothetical protein
MDEQLLSQAVELVKSGEKNAARDRLLKILESDQTNEIAWLWLVETLDNDQQRMRALERCLKFIPDSQHARLGLEKLRSRQKDIAVHAGTIQNQFTIEPDIQVENAPTAFTYGEPSDLELVETVLSEDERAKQIEQEPLIEDDQYNLLGSEPVQPNVSLEIERLDTKSAEIKAEGTELIEEKETPEISPELDQKKRAQRRSVALILGFLGLLVLISVIAGSMALSQYLWPLRDGSFDLKLFLM